MVPIQICLKYVHDQNNHSISFVKSFGWYSSSLKILREYEFEDLMMRHAGDSAGRGDSDGETKEESTEELRFQDVELVEEVERKEAIPPPKAASKKKRKRKKKKKKKK